MKDPNRKIDNTCLKIFTYDGVHRDYAAHWFRWGFISGKIIYKGCRVLDIGCGVQTPLARMISNSEESLSMIPKSYLGVDYNALKDPFHTKWTSYVEKFNFAERWKELNGSDYDVITCLEVAEHMTMPALRKTLRGALSLAHGDTKLVLSTPVANGRPAKNHINECTIPVLAAELRNAGWRVDKRFGTFASYNDIKKVASPAHLETLNLLRLYYSGSIAACFLAPLYPDASRNNIWICTPDDASDLL